MYLSLCIKLKYSSTLKIYIYIYIYALLLPKHMFYFFSAGEELGPEGKLSHTSGFTRAPSPVPVLFLSIPVSIHTKYSTHEVS